MERDDLNASHTKPGASEGEREGERGGGERWEERESNSKITHVRTNDDRMKPEPARSISHIMKRRRMHGSLRADVDALVSD